MDQKKEEAKAVLAKMTSLTLEKKLESNQKIMNLLNEKYPEFVLEMFNDIRHAPVRDLFICSMLHFVRHSEVAVNVAVIGLKDKSMTVRYNAAAALAYSLDPSVIPILEAATKKEPKNENRMTYEAAIDAIEHQNHNFFVDRDHSGMVTWEVGSD